MLPADMMSTGREQPNPPAWQPVAAIVEHLQQREQLGAARLLLSGYRPLAFAVQQGLYFFMPLALLLGFSPAQGATGIEGSLDERGSRAEVSQ